MFSKVHKGASSPDSPALRELQDEGQRSITRIIFVVTGLVLGSFCLMQFAAGNYLFASFELICATALLGAGWRIHAVHNLQMWLYGYVLSTVGFLIYIIVMPNASTTAYVWGYIVPVLSYLLLGRLRGVIITVAYTAIALALYLRNREVSLEPHEIIDLANAIGCVIMVTLFVHLFESRRAAAHHQLQKMARTDALTGVATRGSFQQYLDQTILESVRSQSRFVLVILDIDHFKEVNDRWGHDAGDQALRHVCDILGQRLRTSDTLGRMGGEEFGLLLRNTDRFCAEPLVEYLRELVCTTPLNYRGQEIHLSATFGLAEWPVDGETSEALYRQADRRLYYGKAAGRNQLISEDKSPPEVFISEGGSA
ncbi:GGDEF domain-containing protein [Ectopseudomonas mendocina]|uniref:diguanylate cyclase n=1 Tax=Ectopseudomonas mendocina TaxID=300 RepID=A0ABZ2RH87_ECTME